MKLNLNSKIDFLSIFREHTFLGVDIGTSSIKIVQLTRSGLKYKLDTYGEIHFFSKNENKESGDSLKMLDNDVAFLLKKIILESGAKAKRVVMSVPIFSSFSIIIDMPDLPRNELTKAIEFQARQYVPIPVNQVVLSYNIIGRKENASGNNILQILLVAIPNEVRDKYFNIANIAGVKLVSLEVETLPMVRSVLKNLKETVMIIDLGLKSTNFCIVDNGVVRLSHNYDISGSSITQAFLGFSGGDYKKAESLKKTMGLNMTPGQKEMARDVFHTINIITAEADRIMSSYFNKSNVRMEKIILSGGSANMFGLKEYFADRLNLEVVVVDPFSGIIYPKELENILKDIGPSFAIALGLAMRK
ncbi:MAG: type IV pilus assembly protein PilM [Patescibacteria group bacterium]